MTNLLNTLDIIIFHRDKGGKPCFIYPYNGDTATHVAGCANLARSILTTKKAEQSFISLGDKFERETKLHRWYKPIKMEAVVKKFLHLVKTEWPPTYLEEVMEDPDHRAATVRREWDTNFVTSEHPMSLNAGRIHAMCAAGRMATANPNKNSQDHQRYRRFVFNTAITMVHEIGHTFITFLDRGESDTPPSMLGKPGDPVGEAGQELEVLIYGGVSAILRNIDEDEAQSGDPHLLDQEKGLRAITQETVDKTVRYEFEFPFPTIPPVDPGNKQSLGVLLGLPKGKVTDPTDWPETRALLAMRSHFGPTFNLSNVEHIAKFNELLAENKKPTKLRSGQQSAIYRLPFNPGLRSEPATDEEVEA